MITKSATICFLGNPRFDTRVNNLADSLENSGYDTHVIGFDWRNPDFIPEKGKRTIFKLTKGKFSLLFYLKYAYLLFFRLTNTRSKIYFAEDIYTLPFVYIVAKFRGAIVVYNSRELFGFLAGLRKKKKVQSLIAWIEKLFIRKVDLVLTTGEMDTEFIKEQYKISNVITIRNLPLLQEVKEKVNYHKMFGLSEQTRILFYQGVLFEGRGIEIIIKSLVGLNNCVLVLCGSGEQKQKFVDLVAELNLNERVFFLGAIDQSILINYTAGADIGLSLIENISVSYYYALPNKLFEYIMASVPVLVSDLPQMKNIVENYKVGSVIDIENGNVPTDAIRELLENPIKIDEYKHNSAKAKKELNWQKEFEKLEHSLNKLIQAKSGR